MLDVAATQLLGFRHAVAFGMSLLCSFWDFATTKLLGCRHAVAFWMSPCCGFFGIVKNINFVAYLVSVWYSRKLVF